MAGDGETRRRRATFIETPPDHFAWYKPPRQMIRWGDPQPHPHTDWFDLFFDLIFVAASYEIGNLLKYSVDKEGIAYFSVLFIVMSQSWYVSFAPLHAFPVAATQ
jgi:hypothetical protein